MYAAGKHKPAPSRRAASLCLTKTSRVTVVSCYWPRQSASNGEQRRGEGIYVSLQALISLAVGPSSRITLLSRQPQGAKLFKYSNSSLLPATPTDTPPPNPLSPASTLPVIICLFIVANLEAIPPINDANCSKWCRS